MSNSSFFSSSGTTTSVENSIDTKVAAAEAAKVAAQAAQAGAETAAANAQTAADSVDSVAADAAAASSNAADALTYKNAAETAKTAAETAQAASETAESNAASSASTASTKASEASTSATNAASSETNSASSATSSATSATASAASASAAATSASNASTSETNAASSASSASTSASTATTQAGIATTKAGEASTSASNASTSESNAASSASNAASSATAAAASQSAAAASAASAASAFDSFDDRYLGTFTTAAEPTVDNDGDALVTGALYFNSTEGEMRVYDGSAWIAASAATEASLLMYEYTATSGQTTFSGADDNANTLSYTIDNIIVTLNGVVLDPDDYTATSGTSIVLGTGAALNDELNVVAFKSFTTADMVSATNGGTFGNDITVTGTVTAQLLDLGTNNPRIRFDDSDTSNNGEITLDNTSLRIEADEDNAVANSKISFRVDASEKAFINSSGLDVTGTVTATAFSGDGSALTGIAGFPSGTLMLFQQTAAPTGWTKQTTHNDKALRVVSGTAGSGGSTAFSTALGTPAVSGSVSVSGNISDTTLSTTQMPSHSHGYRVAGGNNATNSSYGNNTGANAVVNGTTNSTGGGGSHNHAHNLAGSLSSATTAINVQYVDLIIASKD